MSHKYNAYRAALYYRRQCRKNLTDFPVSHFRPLPCPSPVLLAPCPGPSGVPVHVPGLPFLTLPHVELVLPVLPVHVVLELLRTPLPYVFRRPVSRSSVSPPTTRSSPLRVRGEWTFVETHLVHVSEQQGPQE